MNVAFLFNSDHQSFGGYYGIPILERILSTGVIQKSTRFMRVSIGDILTFSASAGKSYDYLESLCHRVYTPTEYDNIKWRDLVSTYRTATVYCVLFQNMDTSCANSLHNELLSIEPAYLGAMDVDFSNPIHLGFFRNSLCEEYRLHGTECSLFSELNDFEGLDELVKDTFDDYGFNTSYEDIGARRTFWDKFDTIEHFQRIADFKRIFLNMEGVTESLASDVIHSLEELHPKLFDKFASAARALQRAETEEDLAQASLSGRRVLESFADYLYPPSKDKFKGRKIGPAEYKNRLWAYIETTLKETGGEDIEARLIELGKETDALVKLFNAGLHAEPCKSSIEQAFSRQLLWIQSVIELSPAKARKPYLAYDKELQGMFEV